MTDITINRPYRHKNHRHWIVQISYSPGPALPKVRKSFSGITKKVAQDRADEFIANAQAAAQAAQVPPQTVAEYLNYWFTNKHLDWAERTQVLYRHQIDHHIVPRIGDLALTDLKPRHVQEMQTAIVLNGGASTANKCRRLLFSALKQAARWEMVPRNVVEAVDPVKETPRSIKLWEPDEAAKFLNHMENHRSYALFALLLASGVRKGELLGLTWNNVTETGIQIEQQLKLVRGKPELGTLKTKRSRRFIALGQDTIEILEQHRQRQKRELSLIGKSAPDMNLVFTTELGTPIDPKNLLRMLRLYSRKAGVPAVTIHSLRHLHVSLLIAKGVDIKTISDRVGHSSVAFTIDRYGHILQKYGNRSGFTINDLLGDDEE